MEMWKIWFNRLNEIEIKYIDKQSHFNNHYLFSLDPIIETVCQSVIDYSLQMQIMSTVSKSTKTPWGEEVRFRCVILLGF